jgi:hypothetical protein
MMFSNGMLSFPFGRSMLRMVAGPRGTLFLQIKTRSCIRTSKSLVVDDLFVRVASAEDRERHEVGVSSEVIPITVEFLYDRMGHPGRKRTTALVLDIFFWPRMRKGIATRIDGCDRCLKFKTPDSQRLALVNITTTQPLQLV